MTGAVVGGAGGSVFGGFVNPKTERGKITHWFRNLLDTVYLSKDEV